jgi:hypothetical protein
MAGAATEAAETLRPMIRAIRFTLEDGWAGVRACRRACWILALSNEKKPPALWARGSTINAGCAGAQPTSLRPSFQLFRYSQSNPSGRLRVCFAGVGPVAKSEATRLAISATGSSLLGESNERVCLSETPKRSAAKCRKMAGRRGTSPTPLVPQARS